MKMRIIIIWERNITEQREKNAERGVQTKRVE
jgi:hypothetical protein